MSEPHELIFYATPIGPLLETCDRYYRDAASFGGTAAQTYPPHCTLTGFFHRDAARRDEAIADIVDVINTRGPSVPAADVEIVAVRHHEQWLGLELYAPKFIEVAHEFARRHGTADDEDEVRVKTWPHLSLAYGVDDLSSYSETLRRYEDDDATDWSCTEWELGLWERTPGGVWHRLAGGGDSGHGHATLDTE